MLLVAVLIGFAYLLGSPKLRRALPFESALALGATLAATLILFELERLA